MITREEFQQYRHTVADELDRINAAIMKLHVEHLEIIALVGESHEINKQRLQAVQEMIENFAHKFDMSEPLIEPPTVN